MSRPTLLGWRDRYQAKGIDGLADADRAGRPRQIDRSAVLAATLTPPPKKYRIRLWCPRLLARHLKISDHSVAVIWRGYGIQPWPAESFRFCTDPPLAATVVDGVGLYLDPPENAIVLSVDEKSQLQALHRAGAAHPAAPDRTPLPRRRAARHDDLVRRPRGVHREGDRGAQAGHRHREFLAFLRQVARTYPDVEVHLVMDNYAAHKHPRVKAWLAANPQIHVHFTPTHASWVNLVECWFSMAERQAIHRGTYTSVKDLDAELRAYIDGWNDRAHPFTWTKTTEQILAKANRKKISNAEH